MADDHGNMLELMRNEPVTFSELRDKCLLPSGELEDILKRLEAEGKMCSNAITAAGVTVYWTPQLFVSYQSKESTEATISQTTPGPVRRKSPFNNSSRLRQPFKSPMQSWKPTPSSQENLEQEVINLRAKLVELNDEIQHLRKEYHEDELQEHIDRLHEYNEIKDVGQLLIGKLAELSGTTTRSMYEEFGLDLED